MSKQKIWGVKACYSNWDTSDCFFYPCDCKETAIKFLEKERKDALDCLIDWTRNSVVTEHDDKTLFLGHDGMFSVFYELSVVERTILTADDLVDKIDKYGRVWTETSENYDLNDEVWWSAVKVDGDEIFVNNLDGTMLLATKGGKRYECYI